MKVFIAEVGSNRYSVQLENGYKLIPSTRLPFYDTARALAKLGHTGTLEMWDHTRSFPRMRGDIEAAAKLTVHENNKGFYVGAWKPLPTDLFEEET